MTRSIQQLFDLTGKTALITDGACGLGLQAAHALGEAGARIMLCAGAPDALEAATAELQAAGIDTRWVAADRTREADLQRLVSETLQRIGDIDILINHAVANRNTAMPADSAAAWDRVMNLHLRSYFLLSQWVGQRCMIGRRGGRIINIAAGAASDAQPDTTTTLAHHTAKAAMVGFTRSLAVAWGPHHITVNAIGSIGFAGTTAAAPLETQDIPIVLAPPQRLSNGDDLKGIVLLLASDAGRHITGQWLSVDAGNCAVTGN